MSDSERLGFEALLNTDANLAQELEIERVIQGAVEDSGLLTWEAEIKTSFSKIKKANKIKKVAIFATGVLLVTSISGYFINSSFSKEEHPVLTQNENGFVEPQSQKTEIEVKNETVDSYQKNDEVEATVLPKEERIEERDLNYIVEASSVKGKDTVVNENMDLVDDQDVIPLIKLEEKSVSVVDQEITKPIDPCLDKQFEISITTEASCQDEDEGKLIVSDNSLNAEDNVYQLSSSYSSTSWQSNTVFESLAADDYQLIVKDNIGCEFTYTDFVTIGDKYCYRPEKGFNPKLETWQYEGDWENEVTMLIYNRLQKTVLEIQFNDIFEWDGKDTQGALVPVGQYLYIIKQNEKEDISGYVTVLY